MKMTRKPSNEELMLKLQFLLALVLLSSSTLFASSSYYPQRLDDPAAVYVTSPAFSVHPDGVTDDTAALQSAIDKIAETTHEGVVFLPSGRYRLTHTIHIWPG